MSQQLQHRLHFLFNDVLGRETGRFLSKRCRGSAYRWRPLSHNTPVCPYRLLLRSDAVIDNPEMTVIFRVSNKNLGAAGAVALSQVLSTNTAVTDLK